MRNCVHAILMVKYEAWSRVAFLHVIVLHPPLRYAVPSTGKKQCNGA